jgi:SanA protein
MCDGCDRWKRRLRCIAESRWSRARSPDMKRLVSVLRYQLAQLRRRLPRGRRGVFVLALGAAGTLTGAMLLAGGSVVSEASPYLRSGIDDAPPRLVAIVPGCRVHPDGTPSAMLEDRLAAALALYRAGKVEKILVSGDHGAPEYDEVAAMRRWLEARGVAGEDVFSDHAGFRTLDTMMRAAEVFGVEGAIVCTQRFHLARAVFLARRAGIDAVGVPADRRVYKGARLNELRETYARAAAFLDVNVLHTSPRFLGERIPITGDGRETRGPGSVQ